MNTKISITNPDLDFLNARLDEVRMSSHERLRAKARLAQAEAIADAMVGLFNLVKRLLKGLAARPLGHPTKLTG
jgi:hypothetical protein